MRHKNVNYIVLLSLIVFIHFLTWLVINRILNDKLSEKQSQDTTEAAAATPRYTVVSDYECTPRKDNTIYLLFWHRFFETSPWKFPHHSTQEWLKSVNCSNSNCVFTTASDYLPKIHDFDAIFLSEWYKREMVLPKTRSLHQYYVLVSNE